MRAVPDAMLESDRWNRRTLNQHRSRINRVFRWAASHELLPVAVHQALATVEGLRKGRTKARELKKVKPVAHAVVQKTLEHLNRQTAAMVQLQELTGMRPGEVVQIRKCDIDRSERTWVYRPATHKTQHHDIDREVFLGPKAQAVIEPFLLRVPTAYLFSPKEAMQEFRDAQHRARKTPIEQGNKPGTSRKATPKKSPGDCYEVSSYRRAIKKACEAAKVPVWSPNQLRHTAATEIRKQFGLDASQVMLGHTNANVTQVYAELDREKAKRIAEQIG